MEWYGILFFLLGLRLETIITNKKEGDIMKCPKCGEEMIWGNDFDVDEEVVSVYSCNECGEEIEVIYSESEE